MKQLNKAAVLSAAAFVFIGALLVAAVAWAGPPTATGIWLDPTVDKQFVNCAATGSSIQVIANGKYFVRVMDNAVNLMFVPYDGGTANYRPFPVNAMWLQSFYDTNDGGTQVSCQSVDGGGDVYFTGTH